jgi:hypothetical protein
MNRTEMEWSAELEADERVAHHEFESVRLVLAHRCAYNPDFTVITHDGRVQFHEVKGFWRDDARVKIKLAARKFFWADFIAVQKRPKREWDKHGMWKLEEIK